MLTIRLSRFGKKKQPSYRIIVLPKTKDPWGDYLENLGWYNPRSKEIQLKTERIKYWINNGAQVSDTVWNLLVREHVVEGPKRKIKVMAPVKKEGSKTEAQSTEPSEAVAKIS